jgi:uncharacterized damage-inducible protein DinB
MTRRLHRERIDIPKGWRAPEAASFLAQLDALSATMFADLRGIPAAELGWQPLPGMNTIGMLFTHLAIVEVYWLMIATGGYTDEKLRKVLGIGVDDDGMPLPPGARPPANLRGRTLADCRRLHDRARRFVTRIARAMKPADLRKVITRQRRDGSTDSCNVRWILFHVLEHQAGHYGQMLLVRHLYRERRTRRRA